MGEAEEATLTELALLVVRGLEEEEVRDDLVDALFLEGTGDDTGEAVSLL